MAWFSMMNEATILTALSLWILLSVACGILVVAMILKPENKDK